jgi:hypothetical protein
MLTLTKASEGVHVIESVLLRPRARPWNLWRYDRDALGLTLVFPGWTARTARRDFREFAKETVSINIPAHLAVRCLWLDIEPMREFEDAFHAWMEALRTHSRVSGHERRLDATAARVFELIEAAAETQPAEWA